MRNARICPSTVLLNLHRFHDPLMCLFMCQGMGLRLLASPLLHEPLTKHLGRSCRILVDLPKAKTKRPHGPMVPRSIGKKRFCCMRENLCTGSCVRRRKTNCHFYLTCLERLPTCFWLDVLQLSSCTLLTRSEKDDVIKRTSRPLFDGNVTASTTFVSLRFLLVLSNPPLHNE